MLRKLNRTTFSRYVRKALEKSGSGRDDIQLDPKYEHLRWLATFIKTRPTSGNVQLVREVSEDQTNSDKGECVDECKNTDVLRTMQHKLACIHDAVMLLYLCLSFNFCALSISASQIYNRVKI